MLAVLFPILMPRPDPAADVPAIVFDPERLAALAGYEIVGTPREQQYDAITRLVAHICQSPVGMISLIEQDRQWYKSVCNFEITEVTLNLSICVHTIASGDLLVIPDTRLDPRTRDNPLVTAAPHVRFYAGAPLVTPDGQALGSLCVVDIRPRELSAAQCDALKTLAEHVVNLFELRRTLRLRDEEIARREQIEAELSRAKEAAEASGRAKDRFFATLSHELRTPLTPVLITAAAMAVDEALPPAVREIGKMIQRNVQHEVRLIDDLLDVSRIINGKLELTKQTLDVHLVVDECVSMCSPEAAAKRQELSIDLRATRPYVVGDAARLKQVVCNLLRNAIRFTPEGGHVKIETADAGGHVRVEVIDDGIGMEPSRISRMFEPFEQADRPAAASGGLGLGLAIAKGFVEGHGGQITGHSDGVGRGATFAVELPATVKPQQPESPAAARPPQAGLRILLVEDHDDSRRAMKRLLMVLKHTVHDAANVAGALALADAQAFDLIISDVGLPDGTGLDLMRALRQRTRNETIPGIALTGYGTAADITAAHDAGFATHLTKPINFTALQAAIREVGVRGKA